MNIITKKLTEIVKENNIKPSPNNLFKNIVNTGLGMLSESYKGSNTEKLVNALLTPLNASTPIPLTNTTENSTLTTNTSLTDQTVDLIFKMSEKTQNIFFNALSDVFTGPFGTIATLTTAHHIGACYIANRHLADYTTIGSMLGTGLAWLSDQNLYAGAALGSCLAYGHYYLSEKAPEAYSQKIEQIGAIAIKGALGFFRVTTGSIIGSIVWSLTPKFFDNPWIDNSINGLITITSLAILEAPFGNLLNSNDQKNGA